MNLSGRLAIGILSPVVVMLLALFGMRDVVSLGPLLAAAVLAVSLGLVIAFLIGRSQVNLLDQIERSLEAMLRGQMSPVLLNGGSDISALAAALTELSGHVSRRQELLAKTLECVRDPVVAADASGVVVMANSAALRLFGKDLRFNAVTGEGTFDCYYADGITLMPPTETPLGRALRGEEIDGVELIVRPRPPECDIYLLVNARPLRTEGGEILGAVVALHDITERRDARQALVESELMAQAIAKTALDAFVQTDRNGYALEWSPQAEVLTGWTRSEVIGHRVAEFVFPQELREEHGQRIERFLEEVAGGGMMGMRYESAAVHRDGHRFYVEVSLSAVRRGDGIIMNAFVRDITQRRIAQEQLIQAQKMESIGQLTGGIAHDFNNMLTVITGTIEILAEGVKDMPNLAPIAKLISDAADRGAQLTASLLAFARKQPLRPVETDVNELIGEVVRLLSQALGSRIEIRTELASDAWLAFVDRGQLSAALVNLSINARDAMPAGGTLTFLTRNIQLGLAEAMAHGLERAGEHLVIEVRDTGTGISPTNLERIFDPFFSTKDVGQGVGLGLSMVFGFVKQTGGGIEVESDEGHGATFRIYLPKADGTAPHAADQDDTAVRGGNETILCVEDDQAIRKYVTTELTQLGYNVLVAENAQAALNLVHAGAAFDLLFTDIVMPGGINGRQLAEAVMARRPAVRVLLTSGYSDGGSLPPGRKGRGIPLLTKPYRRTDLARALRRCLDVAIDMNGDPVLPAPSALPHVRRFLRDKPEGGT